MMYLTESDYYDPTNSQVWRDLINEKIQRSLASQTYRPLESAPTPVQQKKSTKKSSKKSDNTQSKSTTSTPPYYGFTTLNDNLNNLVNELADTDFEDILTIPEDEMIVNSLGLNNDNVLFVSYVPVKTNPINIDINPKKLLKRTRYAR